MKFDIEKQKQFLKDMCPNNIELVLFIGSLILCALAKDLNYETLFNVSGSLFMVVAIYCILWVVHATVFCVIKAIKDKKAKNKEKQNEDI